MPAISNLEATIAVLEDRAAEQDQLATQEACFRLLYRLTVTAQIEGALHMTRRYTPVFAHRWPAVTWPKALLDDLPGWIQRSGRGTPDAPDPLDPGGAHFLYALDGLLMAGTVHDRHDAATMADAFAVIRAVEARAANVWAADDPEAVVLWHALNPVAEDEVPITADQLADFDRRGVMENRPAQAVRLREWRGFAAWLRTLPAAAMRSSPDRGAEDRSFAAWWANNGLLPSVRPVPGPPDHG